MVTGTITAWIAAYAAAGLILPLFVHFKLKRTWSALVKADGFTPLSYKCETFRAPINIGVAVLAILTPVSAALIGYQVRVQPDQPADPLVAAVGFFLVALAWGLYQAYSLATQCPGEDAITIAADRNWLVPVDFATQLTVLLIGVVLLLVFLIFYFDPVTATAGCGVGAQSAYQLD